MFQQLFFALVVTLNSSISTSDRTVLLITAVQYIHSTSHTTNAVNVYFIWQTSWDTNIYILCPWSRLTYIAGKINPQGSGKFPLVGGGILSRIRHQKHTKLCTGEWSDTQERWQVASPSYFPPWFLSLYNKSLPAFNYYPF